MTVPLSNLGTPSLSRLPLALTASPLVSYNTNTTRLQPRVNCRVDNRETAADGTGVQTNKHGERGGRVSEPLIGTGDIRLAKRCLRSGL